MQRHSWATSATTNFSHNFSQLSLVVVMCMVATADACYNVQYGRMLQSCSMEHYYYAHLECRIKATHTPVNLQHIVQLANAYIQCYTQLITKHIHVRYIAIYMTDLLQRMTENWRSCQCSMYGNFTDTVVTSLVGTSPCLLSP